MEREREIAKRILNWFSGKSTPPYEVRLSPTNNCNLACLPCISRGRPAYEPDKELAKGEYTKIVREAAKLGAQRFDICGGGEPFCRPEITFAIMKEIKRYNLEGSISTNGTLFIEEIVRHLVDIGWDEIRFSINGPNSEVDDHLRGTEGAFEKSVSAIRLFTSVKDELGRARPIIHITPIVTCLNYDKMCEFVELAHNLRIDTLILQPLMSEILFELPGNEVKRRRVSESLKLDKRQQKEIRTHTEKARKLAEKYGLPVNFDFLSEETVKQTTDTLIRSDSNKQPKNSISSIPCYSPWWLLDIDTNGMARPCTRAKIHESIKGKKLGEIWNGNSFNTLRQMLASGQIPPFCKTCCAISVNDNRRFREALLELVNVQKREVSDKI